MKFVLYNNNNRIESGSITSFEDTDIEIDIDIDIVTYVVY